MSAANEARIGRERRASVVWQDEGAGYWSGKGFVSAAVAYVALPEGHPDCERDYSDEVFYDLDVNGGLTFKDGNVFGWDYAHYENRTDVDGDIQRALAFFRARGGG